MRRVKVYFDDCVGFEYIKCITNEKTTAFLAARSANELEKIFDFLWFKPDRDRLPLEDPKFIKHEFDEVFSLSGITLRTGMISVDIESSSGSGLFQTAYQGEISRLFSNKARICRKECLLGIGQDNMLSSGLRFKNSLCSRRIIKPLECAAEFSIRDDEAFEISKLFFVTVDCEHGPYVDDIELLHKLLYLGDSDLKEIWREDSPDVDEWWEDCIDDDEMLINHSSMRSIQKRQLFMEKHAINVTCPTPAPWSNDDFSELFFAVKDLADNDFVTSC